MPADGHTYRPRRPGAAPSQGSLAERDAFTELARRSLPEVRSSAEAWRNGLTAFLTLVTTGVIIKGRDTAAGLSTSWRVAVTILIGGGLACAMAGLWRVLAAQAGTRHILTSRQGLRRSYGSVESYHVAVAAIALGRLTTGRRLVVVALGLLLAGVVVGWWAPTAPSGSVRVSGAGTTVCGTLLSLDHRRVRLATADGHPMTLPLTRATRVTAVDDC
ncbi:MAG TPA: hypothetical protein VGN37_21720 [Actinocatenispora sp.]